ncbi:hypothetical protein, partial [Klebsiella pneumoniae]|uniref:hypothetical protein n=1 Tax=Klebsiella pneumoniae TaxID=573 RepID=UPI001D0E9132
MMIASASGSNIVIRPESICMLLVENCFNTSDFLWKSIQPYSRISQINYKSDKRPLLLYTTCWRLISTPK